MGIAVRKSEEKLHVAGNVAGKMLCRATRDVADVNFSLACRVQGQDLYGYIFQKMVDLMEEIVILRGEVDHLLLLSNGYVQDW